MILVADDNENDVLLLKQAAVRAGYSYVFSWANDGEQAITQLERCLQNRFPCPDAVILDVKMPRKDGFEVLSWIRSHLEFQNIPVLIMTTSLLEQDKEMALRNGASAFYTKPAIFSDFVQLLKEIERDWLKNN